MCQRDTEVDFIVSKGSEYIAIEVKTSVDSNHKGTARFLKQYHPSKTWIISEQGLNWKEFLKMDIDNLF
jgi:Holliday junction resolvase-like predicted endonuclease